MPWHGFWVGLTLISIHVHAPNAILYLDKIAQGFPRACLSALLFSAAAKRTSGDQSQLHATDVFDRGVNMV